LFEEEVLDIVFGQYQPQSRPVLVLVVRSRPQATHAIAHGPATVR
jgi:hypothetical protein